MQNAVIENVHSAKVIGSNQLKQASLIKFIVLRFFLFNYQSLLSEVCDLHETKSTVLKLTQILSLNHFSCSQSPFIMTPEYQGSDIIFAVLSIPFILIGMVGNVLVIHIVCSTRSMHSTTNFLLVNLAISDFLTLLLWPFHWQIWWRRRPLTGEIGNFLCKTFTGITILDIPYVVSSFTMTALAIERYHAIMKPFRTSLRLSVENSKLVIGVIWLCSILVCLPDFILRELDSNLQQCVGPWTNHMNFESRVVVICNLVVTVYLPFLILVFCYSSLVKGLCFANTVCSELTQQNQGEDEKKHLLITFVSVTAGFFVCFIPLGSHFIYLACKEQNTEYDSNEVTYQILWFLLMATSAMNPILYAFRSTNFRNGFRSIIFYYFSFILGSQLRTKSTASKCF